MKMTMTWVTWDYKIMKRKLSDSDFEFGIYEVYYDEDGKITTWTEDSVVPTADSLENLLIEMEYLKKAFEFETLIY